MAIIADIRLANWKGQQEYIRVLAATLGRAAEGWEITYQIAIGEPVPPETAEARCRYAWHTSDEEMTPRIAAANAGEVWDAEAEALRWQAFWAARHADFEREFVPLGITLAAPAAELGNPIAAAYVHLKAQPFLTNVSDA